MNRKSAVIWLFLAASAFGDLTLWYTKSATKFEEALPIGNGRLGGMVYGTVGKDRISLNESTVWNGTPGNNNKAGAASNLATARQKIFAGDATGTCTAVNAMIGGGQASFQPVGNLYIDFTGHTATNYRRELDLKTAIAKTEYTYSGVKYTREYFASYTDQAMVVRLTADQPGKITYTVSMDCPHGTKSIAASGTNQIVLNATVNAIKYQTLVKVTSDGGTVTASGSTVKVDGANSSTLVLVTGTNFITYNDVSGNQATRAEKYMTDASAKTYDQIRSGHLTSYKLLFDRVDIDVGTPTNDSTLTTDAQVQKFATSNDPQLVRLYYQFGRYLLISSSRGESQPANLQGVWNESTSPQWGSKYTININTEMNYWMTESANLQECLVPLVKKLKEMVPAGQTTAKEHWGVSKGWVAHHNTDLWNKTAPIDGAWGFTPTGGAWLSTALWEHYLFTLDKTFLADVYPVLKGAAEFFLATMVEESISGKKYLGVCPSASPENKPGAWNCETYFGPTMDNQIVRDILNYAIAASTVLSLDAELRTQAEEAVKRLPPTMIGKSGQVQEWFKDWDNPTDQHRHISHLYGLFPSAQITVRGTPELASAARVTLTQRGDMATGWSLAWKISFWSRLEDGNHAYKIIQLLLTPDRTYANLFDAHPPFQIDGNFGAVAGINEMLVQSQNDEINFLPALPDVWAKGTLRGIRARKGFVIDSATWSSKTLSRAVISSLVGGTCNVRHKTTTKSFETEAAMTYVLDGSLTVVDKYRTDRTGVSGFNGPAYSGVSSMKIKVPAVKVAMNARTVTVHLSDDVSGSVAVKVYNLSGRIVYETAGNADTRKTIALPKMARGMFMIAVTGSTISSLHKVVIR